MSELDESERAAGDPPPAPPPRPRARERGRMRRRLRQQRNIREALLLDLGALVFELHRHGRREPDLLQAKAAELTAVDDEVRALSEALDEDLGIVELVAAGIAGTCSGCGSLLSTEARFCATCGLGTAPGLEARPAGPQARAIPAAPHEHEAAIQDAVEADPPEEPPEAPDEQMIAADIADEPEAYAEAEAELVAQPVADIADEEPEPELVAAPWLQPSAEAEEAAPEAETDPPAPAPPVGEPQPARRRQSRLERTLRGKGR